MPAFDPALVERQFWTFASHATIPSRDEGLIRFRPWQTQRYLISEILRGLSEGVHEFVLLKARQLGFTTAMILFDAFWLLRNHGLVGAFVADSDENKEYFRDLLTETLKTLPAKWTYPVRVANRVQMAWANNSRLLFQVAGLTAGAKKSGKKLGRSRGLNFLHADELGTWGDPAGIDALQASLSERHPARCFLWGGTAQGFNHFYDMWQDANRAVTKRALFVPWWRHEWYRVERGTPAYEVYWDGQLTPDEAVWAREIKARWGVELTAEQWAWYRWKLAEKMGGNLVMLMQEFPSLPEHAFQASGSDYLAHTVHVRLRDALAANPPAAHYRYAFGPLIEDMTLHRTEEPLAQLTTWEDPEPRALYVVACDPAYGAGGSGRSDRSVVSVWRATKDRLYQVAEFCSSEITMQQCAWVCMHLAGTYTPSAFILELSGPGIGVWQEIQRLQEWGWGTARRPELLNALGGVMHYLYRRADSLTGNMALQWKTTPWTKVWVMTRLRDQLVAGTVVPRSMGLLEELMSVRQDGNAFGAEGRAHDDRVIAAALAVEMWTAQVGPLLQAMPGLSPESQAPEPPTVAPPAHERLVSRFFKRLGAGEAAPAEAARG